LDVASAVCQVLPSYSEYKFSYASCQRMTEGFRTSVALLRRITGSGSACQ